MSFIIRILQGLLGAAATAVLAFAGANYPTGYWENGKHGYWIVIAVAVLAAAAVLEPFRQGLESRSEARRLRFERAVASILSTGLLRIAKAVGLTLEEFEKLSLHVFFLKDHPWPMFWRPQLVPAADFIIGPRSGSGRIRWTKGKGVIGQCWANAEEPDATGVAFDLSGLVRQAKAEGAKNWDRRHASERLDMTFKELSKTSTFEFILAWPIFDKNRTFVGCVSIDAPSDYEGILRVTSVEQELVNIGRSSWTTDPEKL